MILVFDTETTGLPLHPSAPLEKQPRIIEFGGALLSPVTGAVELTVNIMINPGEALEPVITKITGITDEDLKDALPFQAVLPQIREVFAQATGVIAHNLPFDKSLMRFELARVGVQLPDSVMEGVEIFPWPEKELCTVGAFQEVWGRRPKLVELYEWSLRKPLAQTHRALDDVMALVEVIQEEGVWEEFS